MIPITDDGEIDLDKYKNLLNEKTKFVSLVHASNTLGTINPVRKMIEMAHAAGAPVLVDGAQSTPHLKIDLQDLDCDFFAFSSHKTFGPMGIGVLYGKREHLDAMPPYQGGGDMIRSVSFEKTTYNELPYKFEAGTPNVAGVVGLGAAIDYIMSLGRDAAEAYEMELLAYATEQIKTVPGIRIIGNASDKVSVISFLLKSAHPHDIGTILDRDGIAIRAGHHCTQPLMKRFGVAATARASFAFYNTRKEADALVAALHKVNEMFS